MIQYIQNQNPLRSINIWTNDEVNDPHHIFPLTNTINIEHYDLLFDFVIQSCNGSNQKSQFLEFFFTKSSYSMMTEEFEYHSLLIQLNEEQRLIFDDVMHRKQLYLDTLICLFLTRGIFLH
jgi:hypothetical protein